VVALSNLYDTVLAYLSTNWAIAGETDPKFMNYKKVNTDTLTNNAVGIEILVEDNDINTLSEIQSVDTPFTLHCMCLSEALRDKYVIEIKRLMKAQRAIVGWWKVTSVIWDDDRNYSYCQVRCKEIKLE